MLDQNTTTVLTTLITVLGTLGGVILGVVLSNRYVARQEKAKRNTAVIEEVYTLINNIAVCFTGNVNDDRLCSTGLNDDLNRVRTLVYLYLPSIKASFNTYLES